MVQRRGDGMFTTERPIRRSLPEAPQTPDKWLRSLTRKGSSKRMAGKTGLEAVPLDSEEAAEPLAWFRGSIGKRAWQRAEH